MHWEAVTPSTLVPFLGTAHERTTLDLKRDYSRTPIRARYELAKDVAALANALGGTLIVGAIEGEKTGRAVRFVGVPDDVGLIDELTEATRLCYPVPVVEVHRVVLKADDQTILLGRECDIDVPLLIINVQATLAGPIGCLGADGTGNRIDHSFRFPIRTVEGTRYLRPDELAFHMNSHERRTLLQLQQLPSDTPLDVWGHTGGGGLTKACRCSLVRVDSSRLVAVLDLRNGAANRDTTEVPLTVVRAVWHGSEYWQMAIDGTVFTPHSSRNVRYGFVPLGGLVDSF